MHRASLIVLAGAFAATLAGCGGNDSRSSTARVDQKKVYRHSMDGAPTNLDPVQSATIYANFVVLNVYDTLYAYKYLAVPYELKPNLAADFPQVSDDGLIYTIKIKRGVHYADDPAFDQGIGREVTADDFVYSIKRHFDPANRSQGAWVWDDRIEGMAQWKADGANYGKPVSGLRALDRYTIEIRLLRPYPQLIYTLAMGFSALVPQEAVAKYGRELSVRPVGSGPFRLTRFSTSKAVFEPNPKFRKEAVNLAAEGYDESQHAGFGLEALEGRAPPFVDRMEIDFVNEPSARWNSFGKGNEIQYSSVPVEQIDTVLSSKDPVTLAPDWAKRYHFKSGLEAGFVYTAFNLDRPALGYADNPLQDERRRALRCAMVKGFDWQQRNQRFYSGIGAVFPGVITPVSLEYDPEATRDSITHDPAGARRMLAAHGWTADNLPELKYGMTNSVIQRQIFEQFRGFMVDIGYPSDKIRPAAFATFGDFNKAIKTDQLDVLGLGWGLDYPDAENTLQLLYGPNSTPGSNNSNMKNSRYDDLYRESSIMQPGPERTQIYQQMNQIAIEECAMISGLARTRLFLWHKDVIAYPDREILGGFWLRYVDVR